MTVAELLDLYSLKRTPPKLLGTWVRFKVGTQMRATVTGEIYNYNRQAQIIGVRLAGYAFALQGEAEVELVLPPTDHLKDKLIQVNWAKQVTQ